ncbi:hypothetical protein [Kushneria phosphatilytica]|uniref:hypothetical protein n=1 Tax=Kushneria phosphatilytica TaxID=657387 RepID=UPI00143C1FF4|nr:hypothetical protein [Kushneria phosphatilytica]
MMDGRTLITRDSPRRMSACLRQLRHGLTTTELLKQRPLNTLMPDNLLPVH